MRTDAIDIEGHIDPIGHGLLVKVITAQELLISLRKRANHLGENTEGARLLVGSLSLAVIERRCILHALERVNYNRLQASRLLGLSRTQLRTRMRKYGLDVEPIDRVRTSAVRSVSYCGSSQAPTLLLQ